MKTSVGSVIETEQVIIRYRTDGIMHLHYNDGIINLADSKKVFKVIRDNCPWEVSPIFASGNTFSAFDKESRLFWGSNEVTKHCSAISMLSNTIGLKLLGKFYISIAKPAVPTSIFSTEQECINWLKNYETIPYK